MWNGYIDRKKIKGKKKENYRKINTIEVSILGFHFTIRQWQRKNQEMWNEAEFICFRFSLCYTGRSQKKFIMWSRGKVFEKF